jgi:hypothetical protein
MTPWSNAAKKQLKRYGGGKPRFTWKGQRVEWPLQSLDRGVNYFVLALERLGATTLHSCDGHGNPKHFYLMFRAPLSLAVKVADIGFFTVTIESRHHGRGVYSLRLGPALEIFQGGIRLAKTVKVRKREWSRRLSLAAKAWEKELFGNHRRCKDESQESLEKEVEGCASTS